MDTLTESDRVHDSTPVREEQTDNSRTRSVVRIIMRIRRVNQSSSAFIQLPSVGSSSSASSSGTSPGTFALSVEPRVRRS